MSVDVVLKNATTTTGEGPHWDSASQSLLFIDILTGGIHRWSSTTGKEEKIKLDGTVGFVVPARKGGYIAGLDQSLVHVDWESQKVTKLHTVDQGRDTRFNDGKCDPAGRVWAGTMGQEKVPSVVEPNQGSLYTMEIDGSIHTKVKDVSISNGLAWTADNKTMYYIDSSARKVFKYDYDITTGAVTNQKVSVDFGGKETIPSLGFPDGMTIDTEGKIWVACYSAGKVIRFDPETGKELRTVKFEGAKKITSCCFGGKNLDELYVTSARFGLTDNTFKNEQPLAGSVFRVTGLGVKGNPAFEYAG